MLVSKLKPTSPYYLSYLDMFSGVVVFMKKPAKKPAKQALKLMLAILALLAAFLANSTRFISNTRACLYTASVAFKAPKAPKAPTINKYKKPFAFFSLESPSVPNNRIGLSQSDNP